MRPAPVPLREALRLCTLAGRSSLWAQLGLVLVQGLLPVLGLFAMQWLVDAVAAGIAGRASIEAAFAAVATATAIAAAVALAGNLVRSFGAVLAETSGRALADACAARLQEHAASLDLEPFQDAATLAPPTRGSGRAGDRQGGQHHGHAPSVGRVRPPEQRSGATEQPHRRKDGRCKARTPRRVTYRGGAVH